MHQRRVEVGVMIRLNRLVLAIILGGLHFTAAGAATVVFFDESQVAVPVASGVTWDTISCRGYLFTYTRDKLFTGGIGSDPIGRPVRVPWPEGVEAQAVTVPPIAKPEIVVARVDGALFDLTAFSAKLLGNTGGAGAKFEVMPTLGGEDAWNDPAEFQATGYYGQTFSYDETSPSYIGNTSLLKDFDSYKISIYVDFAGTALTLVDDSAGSPGDFDSDGDVDGADFLVWQRGESPNPMSAAELAEWQANFGVAVFTSSVPEPSPRTSFAILPILLALKRRCALEP
jgi:hypothetical protein